MTNNKFIKMNVYEYEYEPILKNKTVDNYHKFRAFVAIMLVLLLIPQSVILYYFYSIDIKINDFIDTFNRTEYNTYVHKIEYLINYVCDLEEIC